MKGTPSRAARDIGLAVLLMGLCGSGLAQETDANRLRRVCADLAALGENMAKQSKAIIYAVSETEQYKDLMQRGMKSEARTLASYVGGLESDLSPSLIGAAIAYSCVTGATERDVWLHKKRIGEKCSSLAPKEHLICLKQIVEGGA